MRRWIKSDVKVASPKTFGCSDKTNRIFRKAMTIFQGKMRTPHTPTYYNQSCCTSQMPRAKYDTESVSKIVCVESTAH